LATHFRPLRVKDIRRETADCVSVSFEIPEAWQEEFRYTQGQNVTVRTTLDGEEIRRSYSICSSPSEQELRIAIKRQDYGKFSTFANSKLKKKTVLDVLPPTGRFYTNLDPVQKNNYLAMAAGSGITPIISIIKTTLASEPRSSFTLIYGNRTRSSIIFREQLEGIKNRYMDRFSIHHILSREKSDAPAHEGRIDEKKCSELFQKLPSLRHSDQFFICGPEQMIVTVKNWLELHGVQKSRIHFELFTVPGQNNELSTAKPVSDKKTEEKSSHVTIRQDGISFDFDLDFDGEPILEAALSQGADLPFACKGGVCATCRAKLLEGKVEMDNNYALEPEELEAGFILTCQSHPRSRTVRIDFDVRN
jgi:ring-1,2-phenylacetyl-CoA epoxidase subunit PaaE